jgi:hypothetical protein
MAVSGRASGSVGFHDVMLGNSLPAVRDHTTIIANAIAQDSFLF